MLLVLISPQLTSQIMKLSYCPQVKIVHTSKVFFGQLYVPFLNWLLMLGSILVTAIYNNTTSLGAAYGVCVMFVTFFDTCMVTLVAILVWRIKPYFVFLPWLFIACLDGTFLSSSLTKVPSGAWFTLALATLIASVFILWRFGKEQQWFAEASDRFPTTHFVSTLPSGKLQLSPRFGGKSLSTIEGFGIFFDKAGETTPIVFSNFIRKLVTVPEVIVFFHLRPLEAPFVAPENRYSVSRLAIPNCYRLVVRHGYMDEVITPDLSKLVFEKVRQHIVLRALDSEKPEPPLASGCDSGSGVADTDDSNDNNDKSKLPTLLVPDDDNNAPTPSSSTPSKRTTGTSTTPPISFSRLETLARAYNNEVLYIVGKEQMVVRRDAGIVRRMLLGAFLWIRENTRTKVEKMGLGAERVIEVGFVKVV